MSWDTFFLDMAQLIAAKSKDPSTQTGCVIVDDDNRIRSMGYNGFPVGVRDSSDRLNHRDTKYKFIVHDAANAVASAARIGISLAGCTMYTTSPPCNECAKLIIQAGVKEVVYPHHNNFDDPKVKERWDQFMRYSDYLFNEAKINIRKVKLMEKQFEEQTPEYMKDRPEGWTKLFPKDEESS